MADWTEQQGQWQRIGPGLVKRPQWNCKLVSDLKSAIHSLVFKPLGNFEWKGFGT